MQPQPNPVFEFVASDSFTDKGRKKLPFSQIIVLNSNKTDGNICGGAINYMYSDSTVNDFNLTNVEGCVIYVDKVNQFQILSFLSISPDLE